MCSYCEEPMLPVIEQLRSPAILERSRVGRHLIRRDTGTAYSRHLTSEVVE